jgi:hypothetical protein
MTSTQHELASLTISIGDDNGNGQTDVSLRVTVFGEPAPMPAIVLDLPTFDARAIGATLFRLAWKPKEEQARSVREALEKLGQRASTTTTTRR